MKPNQQQHQPPASYQGPPSALGCCWSLSSTFTQQSRRRPCPISCRLRTPILRRESYPELRKQTDAMGGL